MVVVCDSVKRCAHFDLLYSIARMEEVSAIFVALWLLVCAQNALPVA